MMPVVVAIISFCSAVLGAVVALVGAALNERRQVRNEVLRWRRDQHAKAIDSSLRFLLRAANRRSEFAGGTGSAVLKLEHQREWFDDLVEAQVSLRTALRYCEGETQDRLTQAAWRFDEHVARLVTSERYDGKDFSIWGELQRCIRAVSGESEPETVVRSTSGVITPTANIAMVGRPADRTIFEAPD